MKQSVLGAILAGLLCACTQPVEKRPGPGSSAIDGSASRASLDRKAVRWEAGKLYQYSLRSAAMVDFGGGASTVNYELGGILEVSVGETRATDDVLYLHLREPRLKDRLTETNPDLNRLGSELAQVACALVLRDGQMVEIGVSKNASNGATATYRQIASVLQTSIPSPGTSLEREEYDGSGRYVAHYHSADGTTSCSKEKVRYLSLLGNPAGPDGKPLDMVPQVLKSKGRIAWSGENRLESVEEEAELLMKGGQLLLRSSTRLSLQLTEVVKDSAARTARGISEISRVGASQSLAGKVRIESLDKARTRGRTFAEILAEIERERARQEKVGRQATVRRGRKHDRPTDPPLAHERQGTVDPALFNALVASLRANGGAVEQAVQLIKTESPYAPLLIDALGSASAEDTESALRGLLNPDGMQKEVNPQVLYALSRTQRPTAQSIATMKLVLAAEPFNATALYGLGSFARRFKEDGEREQASALGEYLVQKLQAAEGRTETITALRALENAADGRAVSAIRKYLNDPDKSIRAAAFRALGPMDVDGVDEIVALRLKSDAASDTKLLMLEVAGARKPSPVLAAAIVGACVAVDPNVRYRAVELVAKWAGRDSALRASLLPTLEKSRQSDPEPRIRALARAAL